MKKKNIWLWLFLADLGLWHGVICLKKLCYGMCNLTSFIYHGSNAKTARFKWTFISLVLFILWYLCCWNTSLSFSSSFYYPMLLLWMPCSYCYRCTIMATGSGSLHSLYPSYPLLFTDQQISGGWTMYQRLSIVWHWNPRCPSSTWTSPNKKCLFITYGRKLQCQCFW